MAKLGSSDIDVLPIALGANTFGWTADQPTSFNILDAFLAGGGSLVDTADVYSAWAPGNSGGESETVIGEWLAASGRRDELIISTKVSQHPDFQGLGADNIARAAQASLGRLQTDHIDIYFAHRDDPQTPLEETVGAFAKLVESGAVRYIGLSNFTAERIDDWVRVSEQLGAPRPVTLQPHYNLMERDEFERDLQPAAAEHELGVLPYYGLAAGFLTGKYRSAKDGEGVARSRMVSAYLNPAGFAVADAVREIASELNVAPASVALAWLGDQPTITAPIAGATSLEQVKPLLDAATLALSSEQLDRLQQVSGAYQTA